MGYPFACPDLIGGGEYLSFRNLAAVDQELIVRAAQVHALMPMMQFSVAPWRVLSPANLAICRRMAALHTERGEEILALAREAAKTGEPIVRSLEYAYPHQGYADVVDQFLLGPDVLVAPVVEKGARKRRVLVPPGTWRGDDGTVVTGPASVEVEAPLERLPWYRRVGPVRGARPVGDEGRSPRIRDRPVESLGMTGPAMEYRQLGRTDMKVSAISFGAWAIGGTWGPVDDEESMRALHAAVDAGTNFVDTADVYGDGRSERLVARLRRERKGETIFVATKAGRRLPKQTPEGYSRANLTAWVERSLKNLEMEAVDLLQLHCPPPEGLRHAGGLRHPRRAGGGGQDPPLRGERRDGRGGAPRAPPPRRADDPDHLQHVPAASRPRSSSPRRCDPARGDPRPGAPRERAADRQADEGLDLRRRTTTAASTARAQAFDKGETFSGVPYDVGLEAVERLRPLVPAGATMSQLALRWTLMFDAVSCAIPGAKTPRRRATTRPPPPCRRSPPRPWRR